MDRQILKALLECPVCFEVRRDTNIYQCSSGHIICAVCKANVNIANCHSCRGQYSEPAVRSLQTEKLIRESNFEFPCKFANEGCTIVDVTTGLLIHEGECHFRRLKCNYNNCNVSLTTKDFDEHVKEYHITCKYVEDGCKYNEKQAMVDEHERKCGHRKVPCPNGCCDQFVNADDVINHLKDHHRLILLESTTGDIAVHFPVRENHLLPSSATEWVSKIVRVRDQVFVFRSHKSIKDLFYTWAKVIGDRSLADQYMVDIEVYGNGAMYKKKCKVHPIDKDDKTIMEELNCFRICTDNVKQCMVNTMLEGGEIPLSNQFNASYKFTESN